MTEGPGANRGIYKERYRLWSPWSQARDIMKTDHWILQWRLWRATLAASLEW